MCSFFLFRDLFTKSWLCLQKQYRFYFDTVRKDTVIFGTNAMRYFVCWTELNQNETFNYYVPFSITTMTAFYLTMQRLCYELSNEET